MDALHSPKIHQSYRFQVYCMDKTFKIKCCNTVIFYMYVFSCFELFVPFLLHLAVLMENDMCN